MCVFQRIEKVEICKNNFCSCERSIWQNDVFYETIDWKLFSNLKRVSSFLWGFSRYKSDDIMLVEMILDADPNWVEKNLSCESNLYSFCLSGDYPNCGFTKTWLNRKKKHVSWEIMLSSEFAVICIHEKRTSLLIGRCT